MNIGVDPYIYLYFDVARGETAEIEFLDFAPVGKGEAWIH